MVVITDLYLLYKKSQEGISKQITHLRLQSQDVEEITTPLLRCTSVVVLYLQNNRLKTIHAMENFPRLTCLYLQGNDIAKIEGVGMLKMLKKLYLGYNRISIVEGLTGLKHLTELHIEDQKLQPEESLLFDPRTLASLSFSLEILNISGNRIESLDSLVGLETLKQLNASYNYISDINALSTMPNLNYLNLLGNPIAREYHYLNKVILVCKSVVMLDRKTIPSNTRIFIENLYKEKLKVLHQRNACIHTP